MGCLGRRFWYFRYIEEVVGFRWFVFCIFRIFFFIGGGLVREELE